MTEGTTGAVILAAGASTRLGQPKQLIRIAGETLLDRAVRIAGEAGCLPVIVVVGAALPEVVTRTTLLGAIKVVNREWRLGMSTSIGRGVEILQAIAPESRGVLLMTCDQPAVTSQHIRALIGSEEITASAYAERRGVPAYFPRSRFSDLRELTGDFGARELLKQARTIALPGGEVDIDTVTDLAEFQSRFV
jgi:molybdenum cofactor cytidylyltransferase